MKQTDARPSLISRRGFLSGTMFMGGTTALAYLTRGPGRQMLGVLEAAERRPGTTTPVPDLVIPVERDTDLVLLDFLFYGFEVSTSTTPISIVSTTATNTLVVRFPPQAIGEGSYAELNPFPGPTGLLFDPPPILSEVSGPSQLAFRFPLGHGIPLPTMTAADLLDWSGWTLEVPPVAQVSGPHISGQGRYPFPVAPGPTDTFIEFPFALYLSPTVWTGSTSAKARFSTTFDNRAAPLSSPAKVTDLWRSSLNRHNATPTLGAGPVLPQLSAIWSRDFQSYDVAHDQTIDATPWDVIYYGVIIT
jgi:hypothetical protein